MSKGESLGVWRRWVSVPASGVGPVVRWAVLACSCSVILGPVRGQMTFTREGFDRQEAQFAAQRHTSTEPADSFAWGESYVLRGYVEMFLATGEAAYLRKLVPVADHILDTRDDRRAAREGSQARAVWSIGGIYTVARLTLKDAQGQDAIGLRSIRYAYNNQTLVSVQPGEASGTFGLSTSNAFWAKHLDSDVSFSDLSLDPASPRYFERILNDPQYVADAAFRRDPETRPTRSSLRSCAPSAASSSLTRTCGGLPGPSCPCGTPPASVWRSASMAAAWRTRAPRWRGRAGWSWRWDPQVFEVNRAMWSGFGTLGAYGHLVGNYARMYRWQEALRAAGQP